MQTQKKPKETSLYSYLIEKKINSKYLTENFIKFICSKRTGKRYLKSYSSSISTTPSTKLSQIPKFPKNL